MCGTCGCSDPANAVTMTDPAKGKTTTLRQAAAVGHVHAHDHAHHHQHDHDRPHRHGGAERPGPDLRCRIDSPSSPMRTPVARRRTSA